MLTIRVDYERINGRYTNADYRGKITRCDLTLNTGPYAEGGGGWCVRTPPPSQPPPPSCANYFKIMQIFTRN